MELNPNRRITGFGFSPPNLTDNRAGINGCRFYGKLTETNNTSECELVVDEICRT